MMRGTPTMTTWDNLCRTLTEAEEYPSTDPDYIWRFNAAWQFARSIAGRLDETRTADEIMAQAMNAIHGKEAA